MCCTQAPDDGGVTVSPSGMQALYATLPYREGSPLSRFPMCAGSNALMAPGLQGVVNCGQLLYP